MKMIKKINNNVAVGLDGNHKEAVVFGKGIGFPPMPYELDDLSRIERTYYDIDPRFFDLIDSLDEKVLMLCTKMIGIITTKLEGEWNPNLVFILADHLNFAIERNRKGLSIQFPYSDQVEQDYPEENRWAFWIVKNVNHNFQVRLPKGEITCIAMHLINARAGSRPAAQETDQQKADRILRQTISIIEQDFGLSISRKDLNYYRFKNHIAYFVKRKNRNEEFREESEELYSMMKSGWPQTYECALHINEYLKTEYGSDCSHDEILYLMIHINRLIQRGL